LPTTRGIQRHQRHRRACRCSDQASHAVFRSPQAPLWSMNQRLPKLIPPLSPISYPNDPHLQTTLQLVTSSTPPSSSPTHSPLPATPLQPPKKSRHRQPSQNLQHHPRRRRPRATRSRARAASSAPRTGANANADDGAGFITGLATALMSAMMMPAFVSVSSVPTAVPTAAAASFGIGAGAARFEEVCCVDWVHCVLSCSGGGGVVWCGVVGCYFGRFEKSSASVKKTVCLSRMDWLVGWLGGSPASRTCQPRASQPYLTGKERYLTYLPVFSSHRHGE
jgi:hypothetical protein